MNHVTEASNSTLPLMDMLITVSSSYVHAQTTETSGLGTSLVQGHPYRLMHVCALKTFHPLSYCIPTIEVEVEWEISPSSPWNQN